MSINTRPQAKIENWAFVGDPADKYTAPELMKFRLIGDIRGHLRLGDRDNQTTSSIQGKTANGHVVTRNTVYILGKASKTYERMYPGSKERLLSQLPIIE